MKPSFALVGAGGFVAPRHMQAIKDVGGHLVAALDPHDAVGVLDKFSKQTHFFTEPERFERYLQQNPVDWLSVCSPNYLHDVHARLGLYAAANVICEKPLTLTPWNLDLLEDTEHRTGKRVYTVLQLRHAPQLKALAQKIRLGRRSVQLNYVTPRGAWYQQSWKGQIERSGGIITNIGIHMLDLLLWLYGPCDISTVNTRTSTRASGTLQLEHADVEWLLSIDDTDSDHGLPNRTLTVDGITAKLDDGFTDLHTTVYRETLAGRGHGIKDARPAVELAHKLRNQVLLRQPLLRG